MNIELTVEKRELKGTRACKKLREAGCMPAVMYGGNEKESTMLSFSMRDFKKVWDEAGETTLISLKGLEGEKMVLITDVVLSPLYDTPMHVDLLAVRTDEAVEVDVPLEYVGVSSAEKDLGGTLMKVMRELTVEALPKNLPHKIVVDIAKLATFEDQILVKDVALPEGVVANSDKDEVVALVQEAKVEEEEVVTEEAGVDDIEVEKKGKEEEKSDNEGESKA